LTKEQKENLAAHILSLTFTDHFKQWEKKYPVLIEVQALASDLEWSNAFDVDDDWEKLIKYINHLDYQLHMQTVDVLTIQDFIGYCHKVLAERPEYMREKEQERPAAAIVGASFADSFDKLKEQYPQLIEIYDLASNLEISNTANTTTDWRRIKELITELERKVINEST